ncbi:hemerythrin domain-containing protein [Streptomyces sp. NPDC015125]|uniref:hemerythrin domain-containing protein n=1 Tax=Streptomyces sp. NPDC015125 TaxID=3364938 RepID=UPI0036F68B19
MDGALWDGRGAEALPRYLRGFAQTHLALRRDSRRLRSAAALLTPAGMPAAADWWRQLRGIIEWHHRTEDDILWPGLMPHLPEVTAAAHRLIEDHVALDEMMLRVTEAMDSGLADRLAGAAADFDEIMHRHLLEEEAVSFPVFDKVPGPVFTALERSVLAAAPLRVKRVLPPWLLDGLPAPAGVMPAPVRLLGRAVLENGYRRSVAAILEPR